MRHDILERLIAKGAIHSIGMGGGMGDDGGNKGGGRNGNNGDRSSGDRGNDRSNDNKDKYGNRQVEGYSPSKGYHDRQREASKDKEMTKAVVKDFKNRHDMDYDKGSAVRSLTRARASMDRRPAESVRTNAFAANRTLDAYSGIAHSDSVTESSQKDFDHAAGAMTTAEKHNAVDMGVDTANKGARQAASAVSMASGLLGAPAVGAAVDVGMAAYDGYSRTKAMESLGVPQNAVDVGLETARGLAPGMVASKTAPVGANIGASIAGVPGAVVGGIATAAGTTAAVDHAMNPANSPSSSGSRSTSASNGSAGTSIASARTSMAPPKTTAAIQTPSFGVGKIDTQKYSSGLLTARI